MSSRLSIGHQANNLVLKKHHVTKTATEEINTIGRDGLLESLQDACKNVSGETRIEATDRKIGVFSAKTKTRIGFWNVRTMYETGKLAQVTAEMRRYNLHFLGISKSRWTRSGRYRTNIGKTVLYSGKDNNQHHEGVTIIPKKEMEKCLMDSRLTKVRMKGKHINTTIIQCYAPTNDSGEENKVELYSSIMA